MCSERSVPAPTKAFLIGVVLISLFFACLYQLGVPLRATHGARVNGDEPFYLLTAVSLLEDGDLDLANDYDLHRYRAFFHHEQELWYQSRPTADGRILSPHNIGLSILIMPSYAIAGVDGVKQFLALIGGLTVGLMALLAHRATGYAAASLLAASMLGFSAPLFVYATQIYPEGPAASVVVFCVWVLLGRSRGVLTGLAAAVAVTALLWLGSKYIVIGAIISILFVLRLTSLGRASLASVLVANGAFYLWFHVSTFGGATPYSVNTVYFGNTTAQIVGMHLELWNRLYRLAGLWIDGEFGLIRWAPVLLLALPALPLMTRRMGPGRWVIPLVFAGGFFVATFLTITMRGWWFPGRMMITVLPLLAVPLAYTLSRLPYFAVLSWAAALLAAYSFGITLALYIETLGEGVVLAVDPFAMLWPPFAMASSLFPVYDSYEISTWLLTGLWILLGAGFVMLSRRNVFKTALELTGEREGDHQDTVEVA